MWLPAAAHKENLCAFIPCPLGKTAALWEGNKDPLRCHSVSVWEARKTEGETENDSARPETISVQQALGQCS